MQKAQFDLHATIEERHWWFVGRRRILRSLVASVLPPSRKSLIIDVGCGTGANIAAFAGGYRCVGIDTSADAIAHARSRFPSVTFLNGMAPDDLGDLAGQADLFMLTDVLEHVEDDKGMLARLLASVRPGAHVLLTVPADPSLWSNHDVSFGHYRRYTRQTFRAVWKGLPVRPRLVSAFNSRLFPVVKAIRTMNRLRNETSGDAGTDLALPSGPINKILTGFFAGESKRLVDVISRRGAKPYCSGVSLVAILLREPGDIAF